mmetsp:Transcript_21463/g.45249  ORF Transcript_21463/g.45249 Transcript_21463/m.45249 type:complete len:119 (-) Transcript_21463:582-938(-)
MRIISKTEIPTIVPCFQTHQWTAMQKIEKRRLAMATIDMITPTLLEAIPCAYNGDSLSGACLLHQGFQRRQQLGTDITSGSHVDRLSIKHRDHRFPLHRGESKLRGVEATAADTTKYI